MTDKFLLHAEPCSATGIFHGSECVECRGKGYRLMIDGRVSTGATGPATPQGVEKQSAFWWPCRKTLMTEAPTPLAPEEEVELDRLCEEYRVATASVRKNMRFGNPPDPGVVHMFVSRNRAAAAILARIKQILGVSRLTTHRSLGIQICAHPSVPIRVPRRLVAPPPEPGRGC